MLEALRVARLPERAAEVGARFESALAKALREVPGVGDIRGQGLMVGVLLGSGGRPSRCSARSRRPAIS